jgi:hypothetical protein
MVSFFCAFHCVAFGPLLGREGTYLAVTAKDAILATAASLVRWMTGNARYRNPHGEIRRHRDRPGQLRIEPHDAVRADDEVRGVQCF